MSDSPSSSASAKPLPGTPDSGEAVPFAIDAPVLAQWLADGTCQALIDVREPWECQICQISGSLSIPMGELPDRLSELPKGAPFVVYCHHGGRSFQVVTWLRRTGFTQAVNLDGGIEAWSVAVDPTVPTY